jgi:hypothetical protein
MGSEVRADRFPQPIVEGATDMNIPQSLLTLYRRLTNRNDPTENQENYEMFQRLLRIQVGANC